MKRIKKVVSLERISAELLHGSVERAISQLSTIKQKYPNFSNLQLEPDYDSETLCDYILLGTRLETDEEYEHRSKINKRTQERKAKEKEQNLQAELQEYLRLKSKFDKSNWKECKEN